MKLCRRDFLVTSCIAAVPLLNLREMSLEEREILLIKKHTAKWLSLDKDHGPCEVRVDYDPHTICDGDSGYRMVIICDGYACHSRMKENRRRWDWQCAGAVESIAFVTRSRSFVEIGRQIREMEKRIFPAHCR